MDKGAESAINRMKRGTQPVPGGMPKGKAVWISPVSPRNLASNPWLTRKTTSSNTSFTRQSKHQMLHPSKRCFLSKGAFIGEGSGSLVPTETWPLLLGTMRCRAELVTAPNVSVPTVPEPMFNEEDSDKQEPRLLFTGTNPIRGRWTNTHYRKWQCLTSMQRVPTIFQKLGNFLLSLFLMTSERLKKNW